MLPAAGCRSVRRQVSPAAGVRREGCWMTPPGAGPSVRQSQRRRHLGDQLVALERLADQLHPVVEPAVMHDRVLGVARHVEHPHLGAQGVDPFRQLAAAHRGPAAPRRSGAGRSPRRGRRTGAGPPRRPPPPAPGSRHRPGSRPRPPAPPVSSSTPSTAWALPRGSSAGALHARPEGCCADRTRQVEPNGGGRVRARNRSSRGRPDCLTKPNTMASPRPVPLPSGLVVKNGSNTRAATSGLMPWPVSDTASMA